MLRVSKSQIGLCAVLASCTPNLPLASPVYPPVKIEETPCNGVSTPVLGSAAQCTYSDYTLRKFRGEPIKVSSYFIIDEDNHEFEIKWYAWTQPDTVPEVMVFLPKCAEETSNVPLAIGDGWMGRLYVTSAAADSVGLLSEYIIIRTQDYSLPRRHPGCLNGRLLPPTQRPPANSEPQDTLRTIKSKFGQINPINRNK